jgi:hypothetical protein
VSRPSLWRNVIYRRLVPENIEFVNQEIAELKNLELDEFDGVSQLFRQEEAVVNAERRDIPLTLAGHSFGGL